MSDEELEKVNDELLELKEKEDLEQTEHSFRKAVKRLFDKIKEGLHGHQEADKQKENVEESQEDKKTTGEKN